MYDDFDRPSIPPILVVIYVLHGALTVLYCGYIIWNLVEKVMIGEIFDYWYLHIFPREGEGTHDIGWGLLMICGYLAWCFVTVYLSIALSCFWTWIIRLIMFKDSTKPDLRREKWDRLMSKKLSPSLGICILYVVVFLGVYIWKALEAILYMLPLVLNDKLVEGEVGYVLFGLFTGTFLLPLTIFVAVFAGVFLFVFCCGILFGWLGCAKMVIYMSTPPIVKSY